MEKLNKEQFEAVTQKDGPLLIVAGAGTGKTSVITQKIAWLIEQGNANTEEILALTFTEKAAGEMEERVDRLLPMGYLDLWISTFHSFCERVLREEGLVIGLPIDFKLLNTTEGWMLVKKNIDKFDLDYYKPLGNPTKFIHALLNHFSRAKDEVIGPEDYLEYAEKLKLDSDRAESTGNSDDLEEDILKTKEIAESYHVYQKLLLENNYLDFGDLINYTLKLFKKRPKILEKYQKQFKYVLVDEFQDTNWAQYELIKMLASPRNNLTVVGDDDQCLPGSAKILIKGGEKRIDNIKKGEEVATAVGKGYLSYNKVNYVKKNNKKTRLLTFKTEKGHKLTVTDNHKMFCFIPSFWHHHEGAGRRYYYVYLMHKQELGWRLGITNDLSNRLKLERSADKLVAIKSFETEEEARYNETLYSLKYGIPTVCFQERGGVMTKRMWSEKLYEELNVEEGVNKLADDLGVNLKYHQVCLDGVNRGGKVRIKIILEMCYRNYRSKNDKKGFLKNPKVSHVLRVETSHKSTLKKLESMGFTLSKSKKDGKRLRMSSIDLSYLGKLALKIQRETGAIIENRIKIGRTNIAHKKALVVPAANVFCGMFLPIVTNSGIVYDQIIEKEESIKKTTVYDLEVDRTHNFVADGVVVHNSIFRFRGASMSNILQFKKDYPESKNIVLINNYRNNQNILDLSYDFIKLNNPNRLEVQLKEEKNNLNKKLKANVEGRGKIECINAESLDGEVEKVLMKMAELKTKDAEASWNDFAILVRANDMANNFIPTLEREGVPYIFLASRGLYIKLIIMNIVSYLKLLDNYHEGSAMYRILSNPVFNFSQKEISDINYWATRKTLSLYETLKTAAGFGFEKEALKKINKVLSLIDKHTELARYKGVAEVTLQFLNDSGYLKYLTEKGEQEVRDNTSLLNQFYKRIQEFERGNDDRSVRNFLHELGMEIESGDQGSLMPDFESGPEAIKILTVHASKGLEFKYIFIVNLVDRRFPTIERKEPILLPDELVKEILPKGDIHLEEERRLFYVAMTRAKKGLFFSWGEDYGGLRKKKPSRFLTEINLVESKKEKAETKNNLVESKKEKAEDEKIEYKLPSAFSFSQIAAFQNCPKQYYYNFILKIPVKGKAQFSFGKTMHGSLQRIMELVLTKQNSSQDDLFSAQKENKKFGDLINIKEIEEIYEASWIGDWYRSKKEKEEYYKKGKDILKDFYNKYKDDLLEVVFIEKGFKFKVAADEVYSFKGVIDRIDDLGDGYKIVDYKTGKPKEKLTFDEKKQLLIYQLAASDLFDKPIKKLSFYYLDNNSEIEFLGTEKELEKVESFLGNTIEEIKKGSFIAKPGMLCKYCDFNTICKDRQK